jgi:hypothetical protein
MFCQFGFRCNFRIAKKIATRLLAALVSTCSVSISTRTTSTDSRPINFYSRMGHKKTSFVWQESLFKINFNTKCVAPLSLSQQLEQNRYSELVPVMGKAMQE